MATSVNRLASSGCSTSAGSGTSIAIAAAVSSSSTPVSSAMPPASSFMLDDCGVASSSCNQRSQEGEEKERRLVNIHFVPVEMWQRSVGEILDRYMYDWLLEATLLGGKVFGGFVYIYISK
jgi:hypothetical protein